MPFEKLTFAPRQIKRKNGRLRTKTTMARKEEKESDELGTYRNGKKNTENRTSRLQSPWTLQHVYTDRREYKMQNIKYQ